MAIDANSGTELPMNPAISLFVTVKDTIEMERLFNGLKDEGAILMPKRICHHTESLLGFKISLGKFSISIT